jgi:hypothetical protein
MVTLKAKVTLDFLAARGWGILFSSIFLRLG